MRLSSCFAAVSLCYFAPAIFAAPRKAPNILFIITDDQDAHLNSLDYMPKLQEHVISQGTQYKSHYVTTSTCCPSRVTLWTGKAAHNTNVTDVALPYGGYNKFVTEGWNDNWLPVWLQDAGYNMYYSGKLLNQHTVDNYDNPFPRGFAGTRFFLDPYTYLYEDPVIQKDQLEPVEYTGSYTTDLLTDVTVELIDEAVLAGKPFFVATSPIAPHALGMVTEEGPVFLPPQPAKRHENLFEDVKAPRSYNFNPDVPSGANWVARLPKQNETQIAYNDDWYRKRLQSLQAVDDMVETLINRLAHHRVLDDTYIFFTTDNGFHIGQHRLAPGKACGYEPDINIPLVIRGPGVPKGQTTDLVTTHTDLAPTFLEMLGLSLDHEFDGAPIPYTDRGFESATGANNRQEHVNVELWGLPAAEGQYPYTNLTNDSYATYKGIRVVSKEYSLYYQIWCTNEHELYDMVSDPGQMHNLEKNNGTLLNRPIQRVIDRLDAALLVLKTCKQETCLDPWAALQPDSNVHTLMDALNPEYDAFYEDQVKVEYNQCEVGYIKSSEGPMWDVDGHVRSGDVYMGGSVWPDWV